MNSTNNAVAVVVESTTTTTTCDACGYAAAIIAAICLGTMGVPIKSEVVSRLDVDALVMQSYKTGVAFLATWLVALLPSRSHHRDPPPYPRLTHWGILSGLFSVPGGLSSVYGIRNAGLAVSVGLYSSTIVLTSFVWGVFVFEEPVRSTIGACCACATLMAGLMGMAAYSGPPPPPPPPDQRSSRRRRGDDDDDDDDVAVGGRVGPTTIEPTTAGSDAASAVASSMAAAGCGEEEDADGIRKRARRLLPSGDRPELVVARMAGSFNGAVVTPVPTAAAAATRTGDVEYDDDDNDATSSSRSASPLVPLVMEHLLEGKESPSFPDDRVRKTPSRVSFLGGRISLTKRQTGMLASVVGGSWGGMNLVPLHYAAHEGHGGPSYVVSFFSGCMFVIVAFWISRFVYELYRLDGAVGRAYLALPSFHVRRMWLQGGLSGALLTLGKFATIIAVTHLGNSVGNCFAQASMLVSGLWGIFRFKEIEGRERILKWLSSACVALTGILWLSYEHAS